MGRALSVVVLGACLCAARAWAVFEDVSPHDANVNLRVDGEAAAPMPESLLLKEQERQAAARERAEKIRHLPPGRVQAWTAGQVSEDELARCSAQAEAEAAGAPGDAAIPRDRKVRLALCGALVVVLAGVMWRRRGQKLPAGVRGDRRAT